MRRSILLLGALAVVAQMETVCAAEDHSAHHQAQAAQEPTESEVRHVPPSPPQLTVPHLSNQAMIELMEMDDTASLGKLLLDEFEWQRVDGHGALGWDVQAWYGGDYDKLWLKAEGERLGGEGEGSTELLWDRVIARWWDVQAGVRHDFGGGASRTWAAFGVQGLAPYWFEVEATLYVGEEGRSAARLVGEYELLLTQRWVLQPKIELNLYGKEDPGNRIGSGLADADVGVRLRYEIRREFAPYVGVVWSRKFGGSADFARNEGEDVSDMQFVAGVRVWF
jgi:copper resistance protein B